MAICLSEPRHGVLRIEIDRPEKRNALDGAHLDSLAAAWNNLESDSTIRVAVITGSGDAAFCAGADLSTITEDIAGGKLAATETAFLLRDRPTKPIISAVNGHCVGGGLLLLLATDYRIAVETATFGMPALQLGYHPPGLIPTLTSQVTQGVAAEMVIRGRRIGASEALDGGLVSRVVSQELLDDIALGEAERLAQLDRPALLSVLGALRAAWSGDRNERTTNPISEKGAG